jgi:hypothetical protein
MPEHVIHLPCPPPAALAAVRRAAEDWGAEIERDGDAFRLHLPVIAGLRRGVVWGPLSVRPAEAGACVAFLAEESDYYVHTAAVVILLLAAVGSVFTFLWPFFPELLPIAPFGAVLALGGWFLVINRLRTSGPEDFLLAVEAQADDLPDEASPEE